MATPKATFPNGIWNGLSLNPERVDRRHEEPPNPQDWDRIVSEIIAMQTPASTSDAFLASAPVNNLGDSLFQGYGATQGNDFSSQLTRATGRSVRNLGVAGNTTAQILTRFQALTELHDQTLNYWGGVNDILSGIPISTSLANIAATIKLCTDVGNSRFQIFSVIKGILSPAGESTPETHRQTDLLNSALASIYGKHFCDVLTPLTQGSPTNAQEISDQSLGIPLERNRADTLHLNDLGYQLALNTSLPYLLSDMSGPNTTVSLQQVPALLRYLLRTVLGTTIPGGMLFADLNGDDLIAQVAGLLWNGGTLTIPGGILASNLIIAGGGYPHIIPDPNGGIAFTFNSSLNGASQGVRTEASAAAALIVSYRGVELYAADGTDALAGEVIPLVFRIDIAGKFVKAPIVPVLADADIPIGGIAWSATNPNTLKARTPANSLVTLS